MFVYRFANQGLQCAAWLVVAAGFLLSSISVHGQTASAKVADTALAAEESAEADRDSDGDGLSDFQELHKYLSDPHSADTAGSGVFDGDWQQRREFNYNIRAVVRVMRPYNVSAMNDDYQDARVLRETEDFAEFEIIAYPLNKNAEPIVENPNWKIDYAEMQEYLAPGITTNWDDAMRQQLLRELAADGINPDALTDKQLVEKVSQWLIARSHYRYMFGTFFVEFPDGRPQVVPGLEAAFEREKGDPAWNVATQFQHELLGKEMFTRKTYGTCTSTANYQTTVLRALGIPTRMIICIPLADASDPNQIGKIQQGITHHRVRCDASLGALSGGNSFTSHTFCEVFVGHRWRRLNYTTLGQNSLDRDCLGLMLKVHSFNDLSEAHLAATWGARYGKGVRNDAFPHSNPYRLLEVSDRFGRYAKVPNEPADNELRKVTISQAYWAGTSSVPEPIRKWQVQPGYGQFFVHCREWLDNAGDYRQYKLFMYRADDGFVLKAKGQPDVACRISKNFYTNRTAGQRHCELEVVIPPDEFNKMAKGVPYDLHAVNTIKGYTWKVSDGVTLTRL